MGPSGGGTGQSSVPQLILHTNLSNSSQQASQESNLSTGGSGTRQLQIIPLKIFVFWNY